MPPPAQDPDDWMRSREFVIYELKRIGSDLRELKKLFDQFRVQDLSQLNTEIVLLKFKSSMWGALLGALAGSLISALPVLLKLVH